MGLPGLSVRTSSIALSEEGENVLSSLLHHALCSMAFVVDSCTFGSRKLPPGGLILHALQGHHCQHLSMSTPLEQGTQHQSWPRMSNEPSALAGKQSLLQQKPQQRYGCACTCDNALQNAARYSQGA